MTVKELIEILEDYNDDTPVYVGVRQTYGSDFAYSIDVEDGIRINKFHGKNVKDAVCIMELSQIGYLSSNGYDDDDDDEEDDEE